MASADHPAERYARDVADGRIVAGQLARRACQRHLHDLAHADARGLYFDPAAGQHALDFFGFLRHSKGEWGGQPIVLEPWQQFGLWTLYGWKRASDDLRRYRTAYLSIARKNGKSTECSGVALYQVIADAEPGAEVYAVATKRDQAKIVFEEAKRMARASREIAKRLTILKENMHSVATASKLEPLSADAETLDGLNVSAAIIDELHAHKTRDLYDVIETATGARRQPLIFNITTAGFNQNGICFELRSYGQQILEGFDKSDGLTDDSFLYIDYTIDADDDWRDPRNWPKANPNLDVSVKRDDLERKSRKAQEIASAQNNFRTKHLNEWRQQDVLWLPMDKWDACAGPVDRKALEGRPCYAGLDLSKTRDTTALVLVFPAADNPAGGAGAYDVLPFFFIPRGQAAAREKQDRIPYALWAEQRHIELTDGDVVDGRHIRRRIRELATRYRIREAAYDPWNATDMAIELAENDGLEMVECRQGYASLSAPCKEVETLLIAGRLRHGGHPVLRWMASNVSVKDDGNGNIRPVKPPHGDARKIDGIVALVMAVSRAMAHPRHRSIYETRGIIQL